MMVATGLHSKHSTGRTWRWRRCPTCGIVERASDFAAMHFGPAWRHGDVPRRCPGCGYVAATSWFKVVREARG